MDPPLMSVSEASQILGVCVRTIYRMIGDGTLSAVNIASPSGSRPRWRVKRASVEAFLRG